MKKYLLNLLVGIITFFSLTELVFAETTMSEEGQYIFNSLAFYIGVISVVTFSFILSYVAFSAMKSTIGLRISKAAEKLGTDKAEIGVTAYSIRD